MIRICLFLFLCAVVNIQTASANKPPFEVWLSEVKSEAQQKGISSHILNQTLPASLEPIERVVKLDRKQPERKFTFSEYRKRIVNQTRIKKGRDMMRRYKKELDTVSAAYGVQPQYIVALWGIETNYGQNTGGFDVIHALATLAYDGRRGEYFRSELMNALRILEEGHIKPEKMKGSWAGAMGQSQFMPSSFLNFAEDFNKDGRRDIWTTKIDVFASAANYLKQNGWRGDERWGREVKIPTGLSSNLLGLKTKKDLDFWRKKGIKTASGKALPHASGITASVVRPDGSAGPAFLVYNNYRTVMRWNRSTYFATSVGLLANAISVY